MLNLNNIRQNLIQLEDSIIFSIIERSRLSYDVKIYDSYFKEFIKSTEQNLNKFGFYKDPEFSPYFLESVEKQSDLTINEKIYTFYQKNILEKICFKSDIINKNIFLSDFNILSYLSRRIYTGIYVAMSKYDVDKVGYQGLIDKENYNGIMTLLTDLKTEESVIERVGQKASKYSEILGCQNTVNFKSFFMDVYFSFIIPLTKEVEVEYLMSLKTRLDS